MWTQFKLPFVKKSNKICINILFGGGLLTEYDQIKNYILFNKKNISHITIKLIGFDHQDEIIRLNKHKSILEFDLNDVNKERAKCFESIYSIWSIFYSKINSLCESNNIELKVQIYESLTNTNNVVEEQKISYDSNIIFTFDSADEIGTSLPYFIKLKN